MISVCVFFNNERQKKVPSVFHGNLKVVCELMNLSVLFTVCFTILSVKVMLRNPQCTSSGGKSTAVQV